MDRPLDPKHKRKRRLARYAMAGVLALLLALYAAFRDTRSQVNAQVDQITIEKIRQDVFQEYISVMGVVEPIQTVFLDATEGGRIEEINLREGAKVKKGDPILRLSNDNLLLEISKYETEVARAVNDLKTMRVALENQENNNQSQLVEYRYELRKLGRELTNNTGLLKNAIISTDTYLLSEENYERTLQLHELLARKSALDSASFTSRIAAAEESVESMQRNLQLNRSRLKNLSIRAPVDGELATLNLELGQVIAYGARIGTINILEAYKLKAEVDEHYISRVRTQLKASCEFSGREHPALVSKIYPEVHAGKFTVDLVFAKAPPPDIRIGQTSRINLELGEPQTARLVPRGGFYSSTGGQWIFVVDRRQGIASKRNIKLGRQNPTSYEVLEGLEPGEEVITSGYAPFGAMEKLILKQP